MLFPCFRGKAIKKLTFCARAWLRCKSPALDKIIECVAQLLIRFAVTRFSCICLATSSAHADGAKHQVEELRPCLGKLAA
jgi:hypothetical protein